MGTEVNYTLIGRIQWKARGVLRVFLIKRKKIKYITIHYIGAAIPAEDPEKRRCRSIQNYHMNTKKWTDIAYNYLVGQSGKAYVGRGSTRKNAADGAGKNSNSLSICVLLGTKHTQPTEAMFATVQNLVWKLVVDFPTIKAVRAHKKLKATSCPGPVFTARIKAGEITTHPPIVTKMEPNWSALEPNWAALKVMHDAGLTSDDIRKLAILITRLANWGPR